jgi:carbon storage regulator CsrA
MKMEDLLMLVLTRKRQEVVVVGGAEGFAPLIRITVLEIESGKVRLGFEAAEDIPVHRLEVWERRRGTAQPGGPTDSTGGQAR